MKSSLLALLGAFFSFEVSGAPRPQSDLSGTQYNGCLTPRKAEFRNIVEEKYDGDKELVTGISCDSFASEGCTISKTYTWSK